MSKPKRCSQTTSPDDVARVSSPRLLLGAELCHGQVRRVVRVEDSEMWGRYVDQRHRLTGCRRSFESLRT